MCASSFTIAAQWYGLAQLPTTHGIAFILMGNRWLSGPGNNPSCQELCSTDTACTAAGQPSYYVGHDLQYWQPLAFASNGSILPFTYMANFTLDLL